jgi:DNA invertase Pin-like site-specific DNA recombinase
MISQRTKAALQAAKARGKTLGGFRGVIPTDENRKAALEARKAASKAKALDIAPIIDEIEQAGITSLCGIAKELAARGVPMARGGAAWSASQVQRMKKSLSA